MDLAAIHDDFPEVDAEPNLPIKTINIEQPEGNIEDQPTVNIHLPTKETISAEGNVRDQPTASKKTLSMNATLDRKPVVKLLTPTSSVIQLQSHLWRRLKDYKLSWTLADIS